MARTAAARQDAATCSSCPATINYLLTLEAETLVDDFLQEEGKHRYIIEDDESTRPGRVAAFMRKLLGLDAGCVIRFGHPLDCFGNEVDEDGVSRDARGHVVDPLTLPDRRRGPRRVTTPRATRSTRASSARPSSTSFRRDTVAMATHLVASCAFEKLRDVDGRHEAAEARRHLRDAPREDDVLVPRAELAEGVERLRDRARELEERGRHRARTTAGARDRAGDPRRGAPRVQRLSHDAGAGAAG